MPIRYLKNLGASLPLSAVLGLWLAIEESFRVVLESPTLLASTKSLTLVLVYGCLVTVVVVLALSTAVSLITSLLEPKGGLGPRAHSGRVTGIVVFLIIALACYLIMRRNPGSLILDPRFVFPGIGLLVAGVILGRLTAITVSRIYEPSNWPAILGSHYAITAGLAVFVFGTLMAQFKGLEDAVYRKVSIVPTMENIIFYLVFMVAGILTWWISHFILLRVTRSQPTPVLVIIALLIVVPLGIYMRPAESYNPDKHNPDPRGKGGNVLLISIDTLRYDRFGCNFNDTIQTPNIDALAEESVIFDNCIAPMPVTVPSHASMLTGLMPRTHDVRVQSYPLDSDFLTIAEHLGEDGFTNGGFVSMTLLSDNNSNLGQGFHHYDDHWIYADESKFFPPEVKYFIGGKILSKLISGRAASPNLYQQDAEFGVDNVLEWLGLVKKDDFFCFLHLFDPHWYYDAPEPYKDMYDPDYEGELEFNFFLNQSIFYHKVMVDEEDLNHILSRYDGEVTYTDAQLGLVFDRLKKLDLWDETMIILTADHGESFEHNCYFNHSARVYQSCIHVPLIIKPPGGANGERVDALCSITDIFPTICDVMGAGSPGEIDGASLAPFIDDPAVEDFTPHEHLFSESYPFSEGIQSIGRTYSVIRGKDKLIYSPFSYPTGPTFELFDLALDPDEEVNLYDIQPDLFDTLFGLLKGWVSEDKVAPTGGSGQIERENLKTLQYLN